MNDFTEEKLTAPVVQSIANLAADAVLHDLQVLRPEAEPKDIYYLHDKRTGVKERIQAEPAPRTFTLYDIESLHNWLGQEETVPAEVFVGKEAIEAFRWHDGRREKATIPLVPSEPFLFLSKREPLQQRPFWLALRTKLRDCVTDDLVAAVRSITWGAESGGASTVAVGKESLSRAATASVRTESALADDVCVSLPVYANAFLRSCSTFPLMCAVDINVEARTFLLVPHRNSIDRAVEDVLQNIAAIIRTGLSVDAPVLVGAARTN